MNPRKTPSTKPTMLTEIESGKVYTDDKHTFIVEKTLGTGKCGVVVLAHEKDQPDLKFCLKFNKYLRHAQREFDVAQKYFEQFSVNPHPNVSTTPLQKQQFTCESHGNTFHVSVMPYIHGVTLEKYLHDGPISENEAYILFDSYLAQTNYLHSLNHLQRDIKPDNLMVVKNKKDELGIILIDFGVASSITAKGDKPYNISWLDHLKYDSHHSGFFITGFKVLPRTKSRIAPEHLAEDGAVQVSRKSEAYSAGYILEKIIAGTRFQTPQLKFDLIELSDRLKHFDKLERASIEEAMMVLRDNYITPIIPELSALTHLLKRNDIPAYCRFAMCNWQLNHSTLSTEQTELINDCIDYYINLNNKGYTINRNAKVTKLDACLSLIRAIANNNLEYTTKYMLTLSTSNLKNLYNRFVALNEKAEPDSVVRPTQ